MKKIFFSLIYLLAAAGLFQSCSEETINATPDVFAQVDVIYSEPVKIVQFVNNLYTFVPKGYNRLDPNPLNNNIINGAVPSHPGLGALSSMVASATDEAVHATRNSAAEKWGTGLWGTTSTTSWDSPLKILYGGIRRTYVYTEEIHPNITTDVMPEVEIKSNYGQALFIRALLNFELLKRFGGYPIVKNALSANGNLSIPKSSYDECVKYIADLCDEAATVLKITHPTADFGRATKGAAMALKSRLLLYAASPLNNSTAAIPKWEAAAEAAANVINLKNGAAKVYDLYTTGTGYEAFFTTLAGNNEIIFSRMDPIENDLERINGLPSITGGLGGTCPTLDLVNDYEMINGVPFDWNNPTHAANPFANRDPRFAKSILYNGVSWMGTTLETFEGGKDKAGANATRTGLYLRKFLSPAARWTGTQGRANHCFPLFRYAEILLNYAEAMNEAYGPDTDPKGYGMTARQALALIRTRAGLTANQTVPGAISQAAMRAAVRHERRIELAFEEHRHMDLRRWKTAETVLNQPVSGLKIIKNTNGTFTYSPQIVEQRVFAKKMYWYPFPQEELSRNPSLVQNPEW